jgi:hypothetical protein
MISHVSETDARHAEAVQHRHRADHEGWCGFHRTHFHVRIPAGACTPWRLAQLIIVAYEQQQNLALPQGPVAGRFRT